jgi:amidase
VDAADLVLAGPARQAELVREGEVSAGDLVSASLERIARLDPQLNAFRVVMAERALLEAHQADARRQGGSGDRPLLGVPIAVKDNVDVAGEVTAAGTGAFSEPAGADSEVVSRLRTAGAIVVGKTHMSEFGLWPWTESATWGMTRSPWDPERTPGGSSGGSAAAVASGMVGAAHAADGGGSIRIPAACCALFGLKPQNGRISLAPKQDSWHGLSTYGFVTRSVLDSAVLLDTVVDGNGTAAPPPIGAPLRDAAQRPPGRLRVALSTKPSALSRLDSRVEEALHSTADLLRSLGHEVRERDPQYGTVELAFSPRYLRSASDEAAAATRPGRLERRTKAMRRIGSLVAPALVERAQQTARAFAASVGELLTDHDVILSPVMPTPPLAVGRAEGLGAIRTMLQHAAPAVAYTRPWNATGQPAASVPAGFTPEGLPLAVQLVGREGGERTLVSLAAQLESERPWADRRPPVS